MATVAILPTLDSSGKQVYRAVAGDKQSTGKTAGEALDALTAQLEDAPLSPLLILQSFSPDWLFSAEQQTRLSHLMDAWRTARDQDQSLTSIEQAELEALIEAELKAATARTLAMMQQAAQ